ncbi:Uncharacterised protein [Serratia quinivorans]|nr:Uncharacterised protein [Serratia quinivorans]
MRKTDGEEIASAASIQPPIREKGLLEGRVHMTQIVRRDLVNVVVEPVGKQQMTMAAPGRFGGEFGVIIGEVIQRYHRIKTGIVIATILAS